MKSKTKKGVKSRTKALNIQSVADAVAYLKKTKDAQGLVNYLMKDRVFTHNGQQRKGMSALAVRTFLTPVRKEFTDTNFLKQLVIPIEIDKAYKENYQERVLERNDAQGALDVDKYIKTAVELLASHRKPYLIAGLLAVSGRRLGELFNVKSFKVKGKRTVMFSGQTKTRSKVTYEIPLLCDSAKFIQALKTMNEMPTIEREGKEKSETEKTPTSTYASVVNRAVKKSFNPLWKPHDLRRAYAYATYERSNKAVHFLVHAKKVLGHTGDLITQTHAYAGKIGE